MNSLKQRVGFIGALWAYSWLYECAHIYVGYLFLVVEVHLTVSHLPPQPVHLLAELQLVFPLIRRFIELLGQVEILAVQLGILLTQLSQLLLQVCDHLRQ